MQEKPIERLLRIMATLRSETGCPWDREQTLATLKPYLVEEAYEVLDAIDGGDRSELCDELGDLLLQIVFQAQICREEGSFGFDDVARSISEKLIRRHPHVFGDVEVENSAEVLKNWTEIKKREKQDERASAVGGIPRHMPALQKADQIQRRAALVGFDWDEIHDVVAKLEEELAEVKEAMAAQDTQHVREEIGDLLFAVVNLSRFLGQNAEEVLNETVNKFVRRFQAVEKKVHEKGLEMTDCELSVLDGFWEEVKAEEEN